MCGIVGYFGCKNVEETLITKLKLLEYRGYDSAGVAVKCGDELKITKAKGEIKELEKTLVPLAGANIGIAHTRWATHGKPNETNAHPHISSNSEWAIVHNGIIENYKEIKRKLEDVGLKFYSDTDTEVIAKLLEHYKKEHRLKTLADACNMLEGSYALAALNRTKDRLYFAKDKSPLYVCVSGDEFMLASDPICFVDFGTHYYALEDKESGSYGAGDLKFYNNLGVQIQKPLIELKCENYSLINNYKHYMIKEIYEGKQAIKNITEHYSVPNAFSPLGKIDFNDINSIKIIGCGTAYHAGLIGAKMFEEALGVECNVYVASEFRYSDPKIDEKTLVILISQSGETADTIAVKDLAKEKGAKTLAVVNVEYSTLATTSDMYFPIKAGVEIAVASTKAYIAQIVTMHILSKKLASIKNGSEFSLKEVYELYDSIDFNSIENFKLLSNVLQYQNDLFMIGRGFDCCVAEEACLKIKETSYINANTYFAGELKHGFLALIDEKTYVIVFATDEKVLKKTMANAEEARARGAKLILLTCFELDEATKENFFYIINVKNLGNLLQSVLNVIPWQIIAYYISVNKGINPDRPRNLAKSVTVE